MPWISRREFDFLKVDAHNWQHHLEAEERKEDQEYARYKHELESYKTRLLAAGAPEHLFVLGSEWNAEDRHPKIRRFELKCCCGWSYETHGPRSYGALDSMPATRLFPNGYEPPELADAFSELLFAAQTHIEDDA